MARYRLPAGPGRPRGSKNRRTLALGDSLDRLVPDKRIISLLWKMAQAGDARAAIYLADRKWGRPAVAPQVEPEAPRVLIVNAHGMHVG